jgi:hypothetical protein
LNDLPFCCSLLLSQADLPVGIDPSTSPIILVYYRKHGDIARKIRCYANLSSTLPQRNMAFTTFTAIFQQVKPLSEDDFSAYRPTIFGI